jgi:Ecdysteroid kinase-like family
VHVAGLAREGPFALEHIAVSSFPQHLSEMSSEWLTDALHACGVLPAAASVASFTSTRIGEGVGMTSVLARLELTYAGDSGDAPATAVVKVATDDDSQRPMLDSLFVYEREVRFYREIGATAPFRVPRCYAVEQATDSSNFVLLLEDVGALTSIDQLVGCTFAQAQTAIATVAPFHAKYWDSPELESLSSTFIPLSSDGYKMLLPYLFTAGWEATKLAVPELLSPELHAFAERWPVVCSELLTGISQPRTLCHGDWRADNLLVDGDKLAVLDFQVLGIGSGLFDIAYFVSQSLTPEVRAGRDRELVNLYVAEIAKHGITLDADVAWRQYLQSLMFCLIYPVNLFPGYGGNDPRGQELLRTLLLRSAASILDTDAAAILVEG